MGWGRGKHAYGAPARRFSAWPKLEETSTTGGRRKEKKKKEKEKLARFGTLSIPFVSWGLGYVAFQSQQQ